MNWKDVEKAAKKGGLEIRQGAGSHRIVIGPCDRGYMTYPCHNKEFGPGLACKIKKWFLKMGIIVSLISATYFAIGLCL